MTDCDFLEFENYIFKLTDIICVIHGTIQSGSDSYLCHSIHYHSKFSRNKVPWGQLEGAWLRFSRQRAINNFS